MVEPLNVTGRLCPVPITMVSRALKKMPVGALLDIRADEGGFASDLRAWCLETGNILLDIQAEDEFLAARVQRGAGFHGESPLEKLKFILLGIRIHLSKVFTLMLPFKKPRFLVTFVSVAEGMRSHKFLKEHHFSGYRLLPVPDEIYPHCGLVFGFKKKEPAVQLFSVLREASFAVEDIRMEDATKTYPRVPAVYS